MRLQNTSSDGSPQELWGICGHRLCSEDHWVKVTDVICKIISLCTTIWLVMMVSHTKYESSFINGCWVLTQTIFAKNIQDHHIKVKGKKIAYLCTWVFIGSSLFPIQSKSDKTCKCPWSTFWIFSHSSKVKAQILKLTCLCIPMGWGNVACQISNCCCS